MVKERFIFMEHMADIKFKAFGATMEEAFQNAAAAFSRYVVGNKKLASTKKKEIKITGKGNEYLLYSFIDELIYLLDAENFIVVKADVKIASNKLIAQLFGSSTTGLHLNHVKAATYAEMHVRKVKYGSEEAWEAQAVIDV